MQKISFVKLQERLGSQFKFCTQRTLQFTRSAPKLTSALVVMQAENNVDQNLALYAGLLVEKEKFNFLFKRK